MSAGRFSIGESFLKKDVPQQALTVILSSLSESSRHQYNSSLKLWCLFCEREKVDSYNLVRNSVLRFLSECFEAGASYGTLNSHRSAISLISENNTGEAG